MQFRHSQSKTQNLSTGVAVEAREDGEGGWEIVVTSPNTTPNETVVGSGFSSQQTATDAMNEFLQNTNTPYGQVVGTPSRAEE